MGEYFDMGIVYPNGESTNYVLTPDDDSIQPNQTPADDYDEYYTKYNFVIMRLDEMLRENNISISEHASAMYIDLAWQAVCKYLWVDYDDSAMLQRCAFAVAQLAYVYYYNDRVKRETMSGKAPVKLHPNISQALEDNLDSYMQTVSNEIKQAIGGDNNG